MKKPIQRLEYSSLSNLCAMMDTTAADIAIWSDEDLGGMLQHMWDTCLSDELAVSGPRGTSATKNSDLPRFLQLTFGEVLSAQEVSSEALIAIKDYAKAAMENDLEKLPKEVAKVLYTAVVARARSSGLKHISSLPAKSFERLARWCLAQSWVLPAVRLLVRTGLNATPAGGEGGR